MDTPKFHIMIFMFYILKHTFFPCLTIQKLSPIKGEEVVRKRVPLLNAFITILITLVVVLNQDHLEGWSLVIAFMV